MFSPGHRTKRDPGDEAASIRVRHKANRNVDYTGAPPQLFPNQRRTKQLTNLCSGDHHQRACNIFLIITGFKVVFRFIFRAKKLSANQSRVKFTENKQQ